MTEAQAASITQLIVYETVALVVGYGDLRLTISLLITVNTILIVGFVSFYVLSKWIRPS